MAPPEKTQLLHLDMNKSKLLITPVTILVTGVVLTACVSEPLTSAVTTLQPTSESQKSVEIPIESEPPAQEDSQQEDGIESVPLSDLQANNSRESCWLILEGDVYDFTPVVQQHPFGAQLSQAICGQDATALILENADVDEVREQLEPLYLGELDVE